jgi:hypothetical protein
MPTFKRHISQKRKPVRRTFVRTKRAAASAPVPAKKPQEEEANTYFVKTTEPVVQPKPTVAATPPKTVDIMASLEETKQSFLNKVESPEEIKPPSIHLTGSEDTEDKEIEDIQNLIQQATKRLVELEQKATQAPPHEEEAEIEAFNGISNPTEQVEMLAAQLERSQREARELREKMMELEKKQLQEKEHMNKTIHTMRKDMYRAAPLHDTKFFSLSNELKDAIKAIETITETDLESIDLEAVAAAPNLVLPTTNNPPTTPQTPPPAPASTPAPAEKPKEVVKDEPKDAVVEAKILDPKKKKKKMLITGAAAVAVLIVLSGAFSLQMKAGSEVDDALVEEYLKQQTEGDVAGIATENPAAPGQAAAPPVQAQAQPTKFDQAQADVPFEQTVWDKFKEPIFGIEMEYPINAVNIIKTDSSITFIRKNGYIFKVQKVDTALELEEYWKQIKATSLNYKVTPKDFAKQKALHLELEDITDFPGDRYLVKMGDAIFDVWYATASEKFVQDDMKRVERMLSSVVFAGNDTAGN